ncbi:MAG: hypothetical protein IPM84_24990 [Anaerolineae bacterium]|nr:hypothetical protein [Anaerolineae bacterium]
MQSEIARVVLLVTQALEQIGIPYAVGGSLASSLHGVMRATLDADIVADVQLAHIPTLVARRGCRRRRNDRERHRSSEGKFLIYYETAFQVPTFIRKLRPFDHLAGAGDASRPSLRRVLPASVYVTRPVWTPSGQTWNWSRLGRALRERQVA